MVPLSDTDQYTGTEGGGWRKKVASGACQVKKVNLTNYDTRESGARWRMSGQKSQPNQLRYAREWRKVAQEGGARWREWRMFILDI